MIHLIALLLVLPLGSLAKSDSTLQLKIEPVERNRGQVIVAVFKDRQSFLKKPIVRKLIPVGEVRDLKIHLKGLPRQKVAVSVSYDKNGNGRLDTNFLGIPLEPYGFANNARGQFGPPKFEEAAIDMSSQQKQVTIRLRQ